MSSGTGLFRSPRVAVLIVACFALAACNTTGNTSVSVGGSAAVGVSSGDGGNYNRWGGSGPPPGRTEAERQARRDYFSGPRGNEF